MEHCLTAKHERKTGKNLMSFLSRLLTRNSRQLDTFEDAPKDLVTSKGSQVDIVSLCDRWTSHEHSSCERSSNTEIRGQSSVSTETVIHSRTASVETDPLWDTLRVVSVESMTETPDVYDPYFWLSGDIESIQSNIEALLMKLRKHRSEKAPDADLAFHGASSVSSVSDCLRLQDEVLRIEARAIVLRMENDALRSLLGMPPCACTISSSPEPRHIPVIEQPAPAAPSTRSFLVTSQELPVTSTRDPSGPIIGSLKQGDVVLAFRSPEKDGRLPLKPRGWVTGGSLYLRRLLI